MKLSLLFSVTLHVALLGLFLASKATPRKYDGYPTVVPVALVTLKPVTYKAPEVQRAKPKSVVPRTRPKPRKLEGVTFEKPALKQEEITEQPTDREPLTPGPDETEEREKPEEPEDGKSTVGSENVRLDAEEFPFAYYLALLQSRIQANWEPPYGSSGGAVSTKVVVFFRIQRSGRITNIAVEGSSGDYLFDRAAIRAVSLSNPLAPLPADYPRGFLGVHFEFEQGM